jgi:hypothetical protein
MIKTKVTVFYNSNLNTTDKTEFTSRTTKTIEVFFFKIKIYTKEIYCYNK